MEKLITLPNIVVFLGAILVATGGLWTTLRANQDEIQSGIERNEFEKDYELKANSYKLKVKRLLN